MARLSVVARVALRIDTRGDAVLYAAVAEALEEAQPLAAVAAKHGLAPRALRKRRDAFADRLAAAFAAESIDPSLAVQSDASDASGEQEELDQGW